VRIGGLERTSGTLNGTFSSVSLPGAISTSKVFFSGWKSGCQTSTVCLPAGTSAIVNPPRLSVTPT